MDGPDLVLPSVFGGTAGAGAGAFGGGATTGGGLAGVEAEAFGAGLGSGVVVPKRSDSEPPLSRNEQSRPWA